ncbi:MAG TPA: glycosyltransferase family 39 protein [Chitinophagaceae bacterium]|jgi:hypothetical protein|nr:glycosyltransferase family 39 protein [Chitinophagaceae bacterium]
MRSKRIVLRNDHTLLLWFIVAWVIINLLQASFIGVDEDEAYYWIYSRHLQWGYFDHPPMVALAIKIGELFGHNPLTTRLMAILFSGGTIFLTFKALPSNLRNRKLFILLFSSVIIFHPYSFVITPDSFLLFFTALFFYAYRLYLENEKPSNVFFLALAIIGLFYSKYQGVLPVLFTFLSNPRLIFKKSAWAVVLTVLICFSPHLWWQYKHDWPSLHFHFFERMASGYKISKTTNYLISHVLIWGPLTTIPALIGFLRLRSRDLYMRAHYYCFWGIFIFFFLFSFRSTIEPHWVLVAGISFIVLLQDLITHSSAKTKKIFVALAWANIAIAIVVRVFLFIPNTPLAQFGKLRYMFYGRSWADEVYKYTGGEPIVFIDSYGRPSIYSYYHRNALISDYNTVEYRKTYFNYSNDETLLNNKRVYLYDRSKIEQRDVAETKMIPTCLQILDSFRAVNNLKIQWKNQEKQMRPGDSTEALLTLSNIGNERINLSGLYINYTFFKTRKNFKSSENRVALSAEELLPGGKQLIKIQIKAPSTPGKFRLLYSVIQKPIEGTIASPYFNVVIK